MPLVFNAPQIIWLILFIFAQIVIALSHGKKDNLVSKQGLLSNIISTTLPILFIAWGGAFNQFTFIQYALFAYFGASFLTYLTVKSETKTINFFSNLCSIIPFVSLLYLSGFFTGGIMPITFK